MPGLALRTLSQGNAWPQRLQDKRADYWLVIFAAPHRAGLYRQLVLGGGARNTFLDPIGA